MKRLYGVVPAVITPFFQDGSLDEKTLKEQIEFLIASGVHGLFMLGSTGEFGLMEEYERMHVAELSVEQASGRIPVFIHTGAISTRSAVRLTEHAHSIGADGAAAVTPYYFGVSQQDMIGHYTALSECVPDDFPLYLYNIPGSTGSALDPRTVAEIAKRPNFVGIKNSTGDFTVNLELLRVVPPDFDVVMGQELMFFYGLIAGVKGCISGIANAFPEVFIAIYNCVKNGDLDAARKYQETFVKISRLLYIGEKNLTYYKAALGWRGFTKSFTRRPLYVMPADVRDQLYRDLDRLNDEVGLVKKA